MVFLHADWGRAWNPYVSASDASLQAFGVVSAIWSRDDAAKVGRNLERSRFRKEGCHSAREAALTAAGFVRDEVTQLWRAGWIDSEDCLGLKRCPAICFRRICGLPDFGESGNMRRGY